MLFLAALGPKLLIGLSKAWAWCFNNWKLILAILAFIAYSFFLSNRYEKIGNAKADALWIDKYNKAIKVHNANVDKLEQDSTKARKTLETELASKNNKLDDLLLELETKSDIKPKTVYKNRIVHTPVSIKNQACLTAELGTLVPKEVINSWNLMNGLTLSEKLR